MGVLKASRVKVCLGSCWQYSSRQRQHPQYWAPWLAHHQFTCFGYLLWSTEDIQAKSVLKIKMVGTLLDNDCDHLYCYVVLTILLDSCWTWSGSVMSRGVLFQLIHRPRQLDLGMPTYWYTCSLIIPACLTSTDTSQVCVTWQRWGLHLYGGSYCHNGSVGSSADNNAC